jgi:hypothetical protein
VLSEPSSSNEPSAFVVRVKSTDAKPTPLLPVPFSTTCSIAATGPSYVVVTIRTSSTGYGWPAPRSNPVVVSIALATVGTPAASRRTEACTVSVKGSIPVTGVAP